ncbi:hypothetical protein MN032_17685 [Agromyces atrinae]|uniref:hypothetical protein n=1 Tax=Agromyces atrinae TaxID=592376 RepID=UPI001F5929D7|nr:hypothetical protein [Agromyces atrinae]MCI2959520.1 hypothetical protein [Agromyces atrinae]
MSYTERILSDGENREAWLAARHSIIGASDTAKLAKPESVELYLRSKLADSSFTGNAYTESGHRWEPMMLAWAGIPANKALIHSPHEKGFAATPDGILPLFGDALRGAECKAKHGRVVDGPSLAEWRQLAWQFLCVPEFDSIEFIWVELMDGEIRAELNGEPKSITVTRQHPKIIQLSQQILPIAHDLLGRLRAARQFEQELLAS